MLTVKQVADILSALVPERAERAAEAAEMFMSRYAVGDRFELTEDYNYWKAGEEGTIARVDGDGLPVVVMDRGNHNSIVISEDRFKIITDDLKAGDWVKRKAGFSVTWPEYGKAVRIKVIDPDGINYWFEDGRCGVKKNFRRAALNEIPINGLVYLCI